MISLEELIAAGFSERGVSRAVAAGTLVRVFPGVFAVGCPPTRLGWLGAALLVSGADAAISHRPAASVLGLLSWNGRVIDVTVPTRNGRVGPPRIRLHRIELPPEHVAIREGLRVTNASRTIVDLAGSEPASLERAVREAGGLGLLSVEGIEAVIAHAPGRPGIRALRRILRGEERDLPFTRSRFERTMRRLCRRSGIPLPEMNVEIPAGAAVYEVDRLWPRERLIVECDSRWHDNPLSAVADADRSQELTLAGFRVHRVRWSQLVRAPDRVAATIATLLDAQRLQLGV